jgi:uncharacterized protein
MAVPLKKLLASGAIDVHGFRAKAIESNQLQSRIIFWAMIILLFGGLFARDTMARPKAEAKAVLIFSHTTGYRHKSIEPGIIALTELARKKGLTPVPSEDIAVFDGDLSAYRAVIFINNTTKPGDPATDWFTGSKAENFQRWLRRGGAVMGIHGASDAQFSYQWYGRMMGAYFLRHPKGIHSGKLTVHDPRHRATKDWPATVSMADEWYVFKDFDAKRVNILLSLDPVSIGEPAGPAWPISWSHKHRGGRVFYTAMGHTAESYSDPRFLSHLEGGLDWVLNKKTR